MTDFGSYGGQQLLNLKLESRDFLVESLIRERDSILLVGNEKSGKSVLMKQLVCSLTSQEPFLDLWEVKKACRITYVQLEGELADTQDRFSRMLTTQSWDADLLQLLYLEPLQLQSTDGRYGLKWLASLISRHHKPDVVIIDPIYFAFTGSLSDDAIVRQFIGNVRILKDLLRCAVILVCHTHKSRFDMRGNKIAEGDDAIFGSKFFKAWADHILMFEHNNLTDERRLFCNTQRSGDIIKQCSLQLIQPNPLYFKTTATGDARESLIIHTLEKSQNTNGMSATEIMQETGLKKNAFYNSIKGPLKDKVVLKGQGKPVLYKIKSHTG